MKKIIVCFALASLLPATSPAADVGFNLNLNVGNRRPVVTVPVAPVPTFMIPSPPVFLAPPGLGLSVAIDIPYDMVYVDGSYYLYHDHLWHRGSHYNGPWLPVKRDHLPHGLRKHNYREIVVLREKEIQNHRQHGHARNYREREYRRTHDRDDDRGRGRGGHDH